MSVPWRLLRRLPRQRRRRVPPATMDRAPRQPGPAGTHDPRPDRRRGRGPCAHAPRRAPAWGAFLDSLHVAHGLKRQGIGTRLLALTGQEVVNSSPSSGLYLWVLEQNCDARAFYAARGGACVERGEVPPPGGDPARPPAQRGVNGNEDQRYGRGGAVRLEPPEVEPGTRQSPPSAAIARRSFPRGCRGDRRS